MCAASHLPQPGRQDQAAVPRRRGHRRWHQTSLLPAWLLHGRNPKFAIHIKTGKIL